MRRQRSPRIACGFGLMSIVVALAIAGILLTIAIPSMLDQITRGEIKAALPLADIARKPIDLAWAAGMTLPSDNAAAGLPVPNKIVSNYISSLLVQDGAIHITFGNKAHKALVGRVLTLRPAVVPDAPVVPIAWVCGLASPPSKMTVLGVDRTDIEVRLLPFECKADPPA